MTKFEPRNPIWFWILFGIVPAIFMGILCVVVIAQIRAHEKNREARLRKLDDSRSHIINIASILGQDWVSTNTNNFNNQTDLAGFSRSIAGSTTQIITNLKNSDVFIDQTVTAYENEEDARNRFFPQKNAAIKNSHYSWENQTLPEDIHLNAERYQILCGNLVEFDEVINTTCWAFFLYDRHIIYVSARIKRDTIAYLTLEDLFPVFVRIDIAFKNPMPSNTMPSLKIFGKLKTECRSCLCQFEVRPCLKAGNKVVHFDMGFEFRSLLIIKGVVPVAIQ